MPASIVPISHRRQGTYVVLEAALPGRPAQNIGVLLADLDAGRSWLRVRERYDELADPEDAEVLEALERHLRDVLDDAGPAACLAQLTDSLSNAIRVTEPQTVEVDAFSRTLDRLYRDHVEAAPVQPFHTHVPLYSLRAAAGSLGEEMQSEAEDWVPLPEGMRPSSDLFVAHVTGRSMEPRIPDGSLNLFRLHPAGSRQGKILLIQRFGITDDSARYTIKIYTSRKVSTGEDQWAHANIRLEPLNPEFEAWDVGPEDFAVVAEWLRVIE
jgi:SOS-response transcriptional repressor LexA